MNRQAETKSGWIRRNDRLPTQEDGDNCGCVFVWHDYQGAMLVRWDRFLSNQFHAYWMPFVDNPHRWVNAAERKPTKEDADAQGCVLALGDNGENRITGYHQFTQNAGLVGWQRLPEPPSDHKELRKNS